jgi:hypothetical protein
VRQLESERDARDKIEADLREKLRQLDKTRMSLELDAKVHEACKEESTSTLKLQLAATENKMIEMERRHEDLESLVDTLSKERDRLVLLLNDSARTQQQQQQQQQQVQHAEVVGSVRSAVSNASSSHMKRGEVTSATMSCMQSIYMNMRCVVMSVYLDRTCRRGWIKWKRISKRAGQKTKTGRKMRRRRKKRKRKRRRRKILTPKLPARMRRIEPFPQVWTFHLLNPVILLLLAMASRAQSGGGPSASLLLHRRQRIQSDRSLTSSRRTLRKFRLLNQLQQLMWMEFCQEQPLTLFWICRRTALRGCCCSLADVQEST